MRPDREPVTVSPQAREPRRELHEPDLRPRPV